MLNVISDAGKAVDWWFMYKLPKGQVQPKAEKQSEANASLSGFNYLYYEPDSSATLALSPYELGSKGAFSNTLSHVFDAAATAGSTAGWLLYNDEIPNTKKNDETRGHCKGVLAFDKVKDEAVWLLHSTPRCPVEKDPGFPSDEEIYGQTFIAITLSGYQDACAIAGQMRAQQNPQIYAYKLAEGMDETDEIQRLCRGIAGPEGQLSSQVSFKSKAGMEFLSIAKNRKWAKDFWVDLVGPTLGVDLAVESWRRGKMPSEEDSDPSLDVEDVGGIDLSPLGVPSAWHYTKDHAKWAVEVESEKPEWVCVADINRQVSQEKRGGGSICFKDPVLCKALSSIEVFKAE